jgi:prevent-host-death family protein
MPQIITAEEANRRFSELIKQVAQQQHSLIIESEGQPQVVMLSVAEYERLQAASLPGRTPLGRKLWELRQQIVASDTLLGWEEIAQEVVDRRGGIAAYQNTDDSPYRP